MGVGINPVSDLVQLESLGGLNSTLNPCATCFMILEDKAVKLVTGHGKTRYYPAGTFIIKTLYYMYVQSVVTGTAVSEQNFLLGFEHK